MSEELGKFVYILYFSCKTMQEIIGVYSTEEKAKEVYDKIPNELLKNDIGSSWFIIKKELDYRG